MANWRMWQTGIWQTGIWWTDYGKLAYGETTSYHFLTLHNEIFLIKIEMNWKIWDNWGKFSRPRGGWPNPTRATKKWPKLIRVKTITRKYKIFRSGCVLKPIYLFLKSIFCKLHRNMNWYIQGKTGDVNVLNVGLTRKLTMQLNKLSKKLR